MPEEDKLKIKTKFGFADVIKATLKDVYVSLQQGYFKGLKIDVSMDDISEEDRDKVLKHIDIDKKNAPSEKVVRYTKNISKKRAIEALRFGLVPESNIEQLTIGYNEIEKWASNCFSYVDVNTPKMFEICGPFGTGKSHTMAVIRYLARKEGYITANVEVDGRYITISEPERLLNALWNNLSTQNNDSPITLLDLYLMAMEKRNNTPSISKKGVDRIKLNYEAIQILKRKDLIDEYRDDLESLLTCSDKITASEIQGKIQSDSGLNDYEKTTIHLKRMIGRHVDDRPKDFIESLAGHALIAKLAGYKGMIITIDEFEVEHLLSRQQFIRVTNILNLLTEYLGQNTDLIPAPIGIFVATTGQDGNVGDSVLDYIVNNSDGERYEIRALSKQDRVQLANKIYSIYSDTYGIEGSFNQELFNTTENELEKNDINNSGLVRAFIKRYIGKLDSVYGPPSIIPV